jgi:AAA+ superfamily predicted ATPase
LNWPFIEVFPSRLAGDTNGLAGGLRQIFNTINELENVVVFIDEVEEIASKRKGDPPSPTQGVTNELLKLIPTFREKQGHLLIVATNYIALMLHGIHDWNDTLHCITKCNDTHRMHTNYGMVDYQTHNYHKRLVDNTQTSLPQLC